MLWIRERGERKGAEKGMIFEFSLPLIESMFLFLLKWVLNIECFWGKLHSIHGFLVRISNQKSIPIMVLFELEMGVVVGFHFLSKSFLKEVPSVSCYVVCFDNKNGRK